MTDNRLVEGCIKKNINAQREMYERYAKKMLSVCVRYMDNGDDAKDAMHDGFIILFDKIGQFEWRGSLDGWIRKLFVNTCLEKLRKLKKISFQRIDSADEDIQVSDDLSEDADKQFDTNELLNCIKSLPVYFRSVFNLYAIEGYSHYEIADLLGITASTSRVYYYKARVMLQQKIKLMYQ